MKRCKDCGEFFEIEEFPKNGNMKSGRLNNCRLCKKKTDKEYHDTNKKRNSKKAKERYLVDSEAIKVKSRKNHEANKDHINSKRRFIRELFIEKHTEQDKNKYLKRRDVILKKLSSPEGRSKANAINAKRRALKLKATPSWANHTTIKLIYKTAKDMEKRSGIKYHVDHIIPLRSKIVCGLHCENNLQILTADDNRKKYNKVIIS